MANESYYFPHDYDASSDIKMVALLNKYGATGVGIYWMLAEMMHREENSSIPIGEDDIPLLAGTMRVDDSILSNVINDCSTKFKLFIKHDGMLTSSRVQKNKEKRQEIRKKRSEAGRKGAAVTNCLNPANAALNPANAEVITAIVDNIPPIDRQKPANLGKGKEKKRNENKDMGGDSTGLPHTFSNNGFFDRQLKANEGKPDIDKYRRLVEYLHGNDDDGKPLFPNVLSLSKQISYKDYMELKSLEREMQGRTIKDILESMENKKTLVRDYSNVYLTAKNWLKISKSTHAA